MIMYCVCCGLLSHLQRDTNGKTYYEFEYTAKTSRYTRHSLAVVTANDGELAFMTLGISCSAVTVVLWQLQGHHSKLLQLCGDDQLVGCGSW